MRKSHFICAVLVGLLVCCSLSLAQTYKEYYDKGEAAYEAREDYANDVEHFTQVLKIEPERHVAIYCRGVNYFRLGRYEEALADFNKVKDVNEIGHHVLHYIGLISNEKKDYRTAFNAFKGAVDLQPENAQYCVDAARAAMKADLQSSALAFYKQALNGDPTNIEAACYIKTLRAPIARMEKSEKQVD